MKKGTVVCTTRCVLLVAVGLEHERKLGQMLTEAGIAFWTEEHLRNKGFFKTPDAKLQVCGLSNSLTCVSLESFVEIMTLQEALQLQSQCFSNVNAEICPETFSRL